jgi:imidazolonepropionase-like amidohydrolase
VPFRFRGGKFLQACFPPTVNMDTAIVKAAVDVAHAQGKLVFTHPQNRTGVDNALAGGVDILAHTIPTEGQFTPEELAGMKRKHTALIPTLTLWTTEVHDPAAADQLVQAGVTELKQYFSEGGTILFGTDVGFQSKYDTTQEFEFMGPSDAVAQRFGFSYYEPEPVFQGDEQRTDREGNGR